MDEDHAQVCRYIELDSGNIIMYVTATKYANNDPISLYSMLYGPLYFSL